MDSQIQPQPTPFHFTFIQIVKLLVVKFVLVCKHLYISLYNSLCRTASFFSNHSKKIILSICVLIFIFMILQSQMGPRAPKSTKKSMGLIDNTLYIGDDAMAEMLRKALNALDIASKKGMDPPIFVIGDNNDPLSQPIFVRIQDLKEAPFDVLKNYIHPDAHEYPGLMPVFEPERRAHLPLQYQNGPWEP
ncbi:hypothetical protein K492DRAFT_223828 [Lichtheimia hyalospora FSU 10163]|nr:hypothetical protein K492DRAFT_223828 [Lichtheimia hyalospora FSU 10163]